jgi:hypothetical protein
MKPLSGPYVWPENGYAGVLFGILTRHRSLGEVSLKRMAFTELIKCSNILTG